MNNQTKPDLQRHYNGMQNLRKDLRTAISMSMYQGLGDIALRVYIMHQQSVLKATGDPFVVALTVDPAQIPEKEKAKIGMATLLAGQLHAYLEDEVGDLRSTRDHEYLHKHFHEHMPPPPPEFENEFPQ